MKKILLTFFILLFSLTACSKQKNPPDMSQCIVDYGNSKIFTHEILDQGINTIKKEFSKFYDFTLYSIKYTDDTTSLRELNYYNPYYDNRYVECMVFTSDYKAPPYDSDSFYANETITDWQWILVRENNGDWIILTSGYG